MTHQHAKIVLQFHSLQGVGNSIHNLLYIMIHIQQVCLRA